MTKEDLAPYKSALASAREAFDKKTRRLVEVSQEMKDLNDEIARLRRTITALAAMCTESPGFDTLGITDSVLKVMDEYTVSMSTNDVLLALHEMGFDLESQKNAAASVHAVLNRLAAADKVMKVVDGPKVTWRGPRYNAEDDEIPF